MNQTLPTITADFVADILRSIELRGVALAPSAESAWSLCSHACHVHRRVHGTPHLEDQCKQTLSQLAELLGGTTVHGVQFGSVDDLVARLRDVHRELLRNRS